jgi:hypothetical protein
VLSGRGKKMKGVDKSGKIQIASWVTRGCGKGKKEIIWNEPC